MASQRPVWERDKSRAAQIAVNCGLVFEADGLWRTHVPHVSMCEIPMDSTYRQVNIVEDVTQGTGCSSWLS